MYFRLQLDLQGSFLVINNRLGIYMYYHVVLMLLNHLDNSVLLYILNNLQFLDMNSILFLK